MTILYSIGIFYLCPLILCLILIKLLYILDGYRAEDVRKAIYFALVPVFNIPFLILFTIFLLIVAGINLAIWVEPRLSWLVAKIMKIIGVK